ncbi:MAG TPA: flagellar protein FliS, partial [bacterium]
AGEFAENLAQVYQFIYNLLIEANLDKDEQKINSALRLAEDIRDLWKETIDKSKATEEEDSIEDSKPELKQESGESTVELYTPVDAQTIVKTKADDSGTDFRLNLTG